MKKDRQHDGIKNEDKRTNNDLQNITKKTKDRATRTPLRTEVKSGAPEVYKNIKAKLSDILTNCYPQKHLGWLDNDKCVHKRVIRKQCWILGCNNGL